MVVVAFNIIIFFLNIIACCGFYIQHKVPNSRRSSSIKRKSVLPSAIMFESGVEVDYRRLDPEEENPSNVEKSEIWTKRKE